MKFVAIGPDRLEERRESAPGGYSVFAASPNTGVNTITGEGLSILRVISLLLVSRSNKELYYFVQLAK